MKKLRLAYFGTPDFAADFLARLAEDQDIPIEVTHVVTQPDRKVGRKQILTPTPVKFVAKKYNIEVIEDIVNLKSNISNLDLALVYAYGEIIPADLLTIPKYGFWNIHPSLLPLYRGPAPVAAALINGDTETGVTIIQLDREMDHGPILRQEKLEISPNERRPELTNRLTNLGYELFTQCAHTLISDGIQSTPQDHSAATYTKLFTKKDGYIESSKLRTQNSELSREIFNKFRGLYPWPGIWSIVEISGQEKRLKITDMELIGDKLVLRKVQLEGKNEVDFATFKKAYNFTF